MGFPRLTLFSLATVAAFALVRPACGQARFVQTVGGFYSPAAVVVSESGKELFVSNAARGDYGMFAGQGTISKLRLKEGNMLEITDLRLTEGLNSPLGLAVLPRDMGPIPAGSLAAVVGGSWTVDARDSALNSDEERGTGVVFVDPDQGKILGQLYLGAGSKLAALIGHPIRDPMSVAADAAGNLIVTDIAGSGVRPLKPEEGVPGILKLTSAAVASMLEDGSVPEGGYLYAPVRNLPTGVYYARHDKSLYWITGQITFDLGGAVMRLPNADYSGEPETVDKELGSLLGFTVTDRGTVIASRSNGDILAIRGRRDRVLKFKGHNDVAFLSPGQPAALNLESGEVLVVVPEMSGGGRGPWRQRLRTFTLPAKY